MLSLGQCCIRVCPQGLARLFPTYEIFLKDGDQFLLAARKRKKKKKGVEAASTKPGCITRLPRTCCPPLAEPLFRGCIEVDTACESGEIRPSAIPGVQQAQGSCALCLSFSASQSASECLLPMPYSNDAVAVCAPGKQASSPKSCRRNVDRDCRHRDGRGGPASSRQSSGVPYFG